MAERAVMSREVVPKLMKIKRSFDADLSIEMLMK
jgi:hypothetical protein